MKNIMSLIYSGLCIIILLSCESIVDPDIMEKVTFVNQTNYKINVNIDSDVIKTDTKSFSVISGGTIEIKTEYGIIPIFTATVEGNSQLQIAYYEGETSVTFERVYEYEVEYKISGTAEKVNVTLNNSSGGTEQYSDVATPHSYRYRNFYDWFVYISAQNQGETGNVTVSIYHKGILFDSSTSSGAYVIATASGSI